MRSYTVLSWLCAMMAALVVAAPSDRSFEAPSSFEVPMTYVQAPAAKVTPQVGFKPTVDQPKIENFGLMADQLGKRGFDHYELNGRPVAQGDAFRAVKEGVPADESLLRVTVIGSEAHRQRVISDLTNAPAQLRDRFVLQGYDPQHWAVQPGFFRGGSPTIYVQSPSGQVLHRQDDYQDGPSGLFEAIRRADPNYTPTRDPDLRKSSSLGDVGMLALLSLGGVLVGLAVGAWIKASNRPKPPAPPTPVSTEAAMLQMLQQINEKLSKPASVP